MSLKTGYMIQMLKNMVCMKVFVPFRGMSLKTFEAGIAAAAQNDNCFRPLSGNEFKNMISAAIPVLGAAKVGFRPLSGNEFKNLLINQVN